MTWYMPTWHMHTFNHFSLKALSKLIASDCTYNSIQPLSFTSLFLSVVDL